ncbi:hypothetical protein SAMN04515618_102379 [Collimonas sp. OK307]|nr:hypothetical protein SAMN04515618_102379 [Collimonas sp. OK307]
MRLGWTLQEVVRAYADCTDSGTIMADGESSAMIPDDQKSAGMSFRCNCKASSKVWQASSVPTVMRRN